MQNDSANATDVVEVTADAEGAENDQAAQDAPAAEQAAEPADGGTDPSAEPSTDPAPAAVAKAKPEDVPQPRGAEPESGSGKGKKRKSAPKSKSAAGTKSLVVFREGKVHYADETVVVLDLDDAAHPDTDVHDVVDKLSELRDAAESSGRTEAVALVAELIQAKALA